MSKKICGIIKMKSWNIYVNQKHIYVIIFELQNFRNDVNSTEIFVLQRILIFLELEMMYENNFCFINFPASLFSFFFSFVNMLLQWPNFSDQCTQLLFVHLKFK